MSVRQSLLAILDQGPCYGYQLRSEFARRTGSKSGLNVGQIYNTLDRLERDGLVAKADTDAEGHVYYTITDAGRDEVAHWLSTPITHAETGRDELAAKVAMAVTLPGVDAIEVIRIQRAASIGRLEELQAFLAAMADTSGPQSAEELSEVIVIEALLVRADAEVDWLNRIEERVNRASATGNAEPMRLNTEAPKRGRPRLVQ